MRYLNVFVTKEIIILRKYCNEMIIYNIISNMILIPI